MQSMASRIRRARIGARMTQTDLANAVGVSRSAVAQWETRDGTSPSTEHLTEIAVKTGVQFEWLATGRGPSQVDTAAIVEAAIAADFAENELESRMLGLMRRLPRRKQEMACEMVELLGSK